ncbi:KAP family P-loop domain-containing protein [Alloyangia pacifica]|uniref:KAP family P-loop domain-containing protein n=2 Tax=Alloyangia pacifica TaxID=311180 RepID=A0A1I6PR13_9RHOB|nr:KAP family P-loop domain-containing protein [Alloyangia pacifica]SFS42626.1 KAP family P-loop domain-containing protein [Alloyangia pacifica]
MLRQYGPKTARRIASVASFAGYVVPGAKVAGDILNAGVDAAENFLPEGPTPSEMKRKISEKIQELDVSFIVILDDLDRLEPKQAVEVVRLVRSVADFPRVAYLMCYDREVLAQALKTGLKVEDGDLFLQKIVQLTFKIPLPEPFDLRNQFLTEAKKIYKEATNEDADRELLSDLKGAVEREGFSLTTPREVKLALNSVRFVFPQISDEVYFPDFCRLHLIKTTNYPLYRWLEEYLSVRAGLINDGAAVPVDEKTRLGEELKDILPSQGIGSSRSIWRLRRFIPGLQDVDTPRKCVFNSTSSAEISKMIELKRLGSPLHHRFYFALTGPKTVMPDEEFSELLDLARDNSQLLGERFSAAVDRRQNSGRTWFEHILDRLDDAVISKLDKKQLSGILVALSNMMDVALKEDGEYFVFSIGLDRKAEKLAKSCLRALASLDRRLQSEAVLSMAAEGRALNWLIGRFFRSQLFRHGRFGGDADTPEQWEISDELLDEVIGVIRGRLEEKNTIDLIPYMPEMSSFLFAWMNFSGDAPAIAWVRNFCGTDEGFLHVLEHLRGWSISDKIYYPLHEEEVSHFLDWDKTCDRLKEMRGGEFSEKVQELELAIQQGMN